MYRDTRESVVREIADVLNRWGVDNEANTHDFVLAEMAVTMIEAYATARNETARLSVTSNAPGQLDANETRGLLHEVIAPDYTHQSAFTLIAEDANRIAGRLAAKGVALVRADAGDTPAPLALDADPRPV